VSTSSYHYQTQTAQAQQTHRGGLGDNGRDIIHEQHARLAGVSSVVPRSEDDVERLLGGEKRDSRHERLKAAAAGATVGEEDVVPDFGAGPGQVETADGLGGCPHGGAEHVSSRAGDVPLPRPFHNEVSQGARARDRRRKAAHFIMITDPGVWDVQRVGGAHGHRAADRTAPR